MAKIKKAVISAKTLVILVVLIIGCIVGTYYFTKQILTNSFASSNQTKLQCLKNCLSQSGASDIQLYSKCLKSCGLSMGPVGLDNIKENSEGPIMPIN